MSTEMRRRADDERARNWLKQQLDWEELSALRDAHAGIACPAPAEQRPAAA